MILKLKQKIFAFFRQQYEIKDLDENLAFYIKPLFSFFPKFEIRDKEQNLVFIVKQKPFRIFKKYVILNAKKELVFAVKQKFSPFVPKAKITNATKDKKLNINGNILAHEFEICENNDVKARVSKKYISITDNYTLEIFDEENAGLYVAMAMIYDAIYFQGNRTKLFK